MLQTVIDLDISNQNLDTAFDDIEWELCCSAREASFGFVPFTNLDFREWRWSIGHIHSPKMDKLGPLPLSDPGSG